MKFFRTEWPWSIRVKKFFQKTSILVFEVIPQPPKTHFLTFSSETKIMKITHSEMLKERKPSITLLKIGISSESMSKKMMRVNFFGTNSTRPSWVINTNIFFTFLAFILHRKLLQRYQSILIIGYHQTIWRLGHFWPIFCEQASHLCRKSWAITQSHSSFWIQKTHVVCPRDHGLYRLQWPFFWPFMMPPLIWGAHLNIQQKLPIFD